MNSFCLLLYVWFSVSAEELLSVQRFCKRNYQTYPVIKLQERFSDVPVVKGLYPILSNFFKVFETFHSDITSKIWTKVCHYNLARLQDLVDNIWQTFIIKLQEMVTNMDQLKVSCIEAEELLPPGTAPQQLLTVCNALNACGISVPADINVNEISRRVRLYSGLHAVAMEAGQLVDVIRNFQIQGDLTRVLSIADVSRLHA